MLLKCKPQILKATYFGLAFLKFNAEKAHGRHKCVCCPSVGLGWEHSPTQGSERGRKLCSEGSGHTWNCFKMKHKTTFPTHTGRIPPYKSPAAPRDAVIAAPTAASPGTAINAIPAQAVHTRGSEGLGPPFICFSTEPDILPGGQSRELRQHRNVQTRLRRATLRQGPVGSVPKTRPRAHCRPSATLSLTVCTELRYWFGGTRWFSHEDFSLQEC